MVEWKEAKLGEVINLKRGYDLASSKRIFGKYPIISSSGITDFHNQCKKHPPGVITGRYGTIGKVFFTEECYWPLNTTLYVTDFYGNDPKFIFYFLQSFDFEKYSDKSTVPGINRNHLHTEIVNIPPLTEQITISSILSSLDDKIDLLHRQNATLERLAETLFRQWFVEEAKEEWESRSLSKMANFLNGLACQKFPPKNGIEKLPVLKIRELSSGINENSDWASTDVKPEYIVHNGDVIFAWSASLMVKLWDGQDCILNQHLFKVYSNEFPKWFYYMWCKFHLEEFISIAASHATTMGHIKRGDLDEAIVLIPTSQELTFMSNIMQPMIDKTIINHNQIHKLSSMRDNLLPKLMSGEVKIKF